MKFALNENGVRVNIKNTHAKENYYCPSCGELLVLKKGPIKRHHFSHRTNSICSDSWNYDMSDWHFEWQNRFDEKFQEITLSLNNAKHRADILVGETVIEFQHSNLSPEEFDDRNSFYNKLGYRVVWVFDVVEQWKKEQIHDLNESNTKYYWKNPKRTFNNFTISRKGNIQLFLQFGHSTDPDDGVLFKVNWIAPSGIERFVAEDCYSIEEFVDLFVPNDYVEEVYSVDDLFDYLPKIRRTNGEDNFYGCTLPKIENSHAPFTTLERCIECPYHVKNAPYRHESISCDHRIREEIKGLTIKKVISFNRNIEGFLEEVQWLNSDDEGVFTKISIFQPVGRTLEELWQIYNCKIMICRNLQTDYLVQVFNPKWQKKTIGFVEGKICKPGGDMSTTKMKIFNADKSIWVMSWFKKRD